MVVYSVVGLDLVVMGGTLSWIRQWQVDQGASYCNRASLDYTRPLQDATSGVYELGLQELENVRVKLASVDELSQKVTAESSNA